MTKIVMSAGYFRQKNDVDFAKNWKHLDRVTKGSPLILRADGSSFNAPHTGVIIMPKITAKVGEDWLYFGKLAPV